MKSDFFIDRPVFSAVISIIIVIVGLIGLWMLPVDQYPQITPPAVRISASYPGASAMTVSQAVATPIEQQLNGAPGMLYMESNSANTGGFSATVTFDIATDPDLAAVEIQNRVKLAEAHLPAEVIQNGIVVEKQASSQLMTLCLRSTDEKFDEIYLSNFATLNVQDVLRRIPGVAGISSVGGRYYAMQLWVQPDKLANFGLTVQDLQNVLKDQNRESAAGVFGQQPIDSVDISIPITTQGRLSSVSDFEHIVVRANSDGSIIRLKDVARVSLEASGYNTESRINGEIAAVMNVNLLQGANAMQVAEDVKTAMVEIARNFPEGITYEIPLDMTTYISESIEHVYRTLFEALFLVILVVFLSLQSWRATLIPIIAVPISLVGTFGVMLAFGFSLNLLTLLGLILAIGIVVDDAIVVVENVTRIMETEQIGAYEATKKAMRELGSALVAMSFVLCAVFVPVSFLSGITGQLYRQFSVTIIVSVLISTVVALTLSPAMCARILASHGQTKKNRLFRVINQGLEKGNEKYVGFVRKGIARPRRVLVAFALILVCVFVVNRIVPHSFMPTEDQGYFKVEFELPQGATLQRTRLVTGRAVDYLLKQPAVQYVQSVIGNSTRTGANQARSELVVVLKPWKERRDTNLKQIMALAEAEFFRYPEAKAYLTMPPAIPGLGSSSGFEMVLEARGDASLDKLREASDTLLFEAAHRDEVSGVASSIQPEIPQLYYDVDRDRAKLSEVPLSDIFLTMKAFTGSIYVNDFNMFNRIYRVYIQAEAPYRAHKDNVNLFFVRNADDGMVSLSTLGTMSYTTGPANIRRFNMFNAAFINGIAVRGHSSGQAMDIVERIAKEKLPDNIAVEWSGLSYQEKKAGNQIGLIFVLVFLFVFLFLAAQYESWFIPVAVLLSLPVALLGAYLGIWAVGLENNVYFQISLVMLMGLVAKNAILIVEFARQEVRKGSDAVTAAVTAVKLRFRPVLMTSLAFILGMLPLVFASGPGAASRQGIGVGVFFGMIVAITVGLILVPFFFVLLYRVRDKIKFLFSLSLFVLFCSCKTGRAFVQPDLQLPETGMWADSTERLLADMAWWELYSDRCLQQVIADALANNKDLVMAAERTRALAMLRRPAQAALLPQAGIQLAGDREWENYGGRHTDKSSEFDAKLTFNWELDLLGYLRWAKEKSEAEYLNSIEAKRSLQLFIIAEVTGCYFELIALDNELEIVKQTFATREEGVRQAKLRFEGGLTSETSYQQAQVELANTATLIPELMKEITQKENEIAFICGKYPGGIERSQMELVVRLPDTMLFNLSSELLMRRPDVRAAEQSLRAANAAVGMAYTDRFPRINLTGAYGFESDRLTSLLKSPYGLITGTLLSPLLTYGAKRAQYKAQMILYQQEVAGYEKTVLTVFHETANAIAAYNSACEARKRKRELEQASEKYVSLARLQYINGVIGYLDVLDAQRNYFDAQIGLSNAVRDEYIAIVNLYKSLGGGWRF